MEKMRVIAARAMNASLEAYNITRDAVNQQKNIRYTRVVFNNFRLLSSADHLERTSPPTLSLFKTMDDFRPN